MEIVTKIAPIALALIMFGLGLGLTKNDFLRVLKNPKDFILGSICQLIILPVIAFVLIILLKVPKEIALGVMIIAAAPGGVTSNIMTKFAKGDVALSISLTAIISLISIISVPLIIFQSADFLGIKNISKEINMANISVKMALVVIVPVILGMIVRTFAYNFITSKIPLVDKITAGLFLIVFAAIWVEEGKNIFSYLAQSGLIVLLLNVIIMIIAYYMGKIFASGIEQARCIAIECGLQNGTLAVFVATQIFNEIVYIIPTATYALVMYFTALIFVFYVRKN
ncbi:MAG: bile acid:sodium symporter family protein [Pelagibacterales bacterium]|nr:bile acid:sodium symporter family protein [Pelagibacterales bacterium]